MSNRHTKFPAPCEPAVLGAVLISEGRCFPAVHSVIGLSVEAFVEDKAKAVYEAMCGLHADGAPIDPITVLDALDDPHEDEMGPYISGLMNAVPTSFHAEQYAVDLMTAYREREAMDIAKAVINCPRESVSGYLVQLKALAAPALHKPPRQIGEISSALITHYEEIDAHPEHGGVPTGIATLDDILRGGLYRAELTIIAGRPGKGKSALALNMAHHAAEQQTPTLLFSLEMTAQTLAERLWAIHDGVSVQRIRRRFNAAWEMTKARAVSETSKRWTLWVDDAPTMTLAYIEAQSKRFAERRPNPLIIIDYMQLIKPGARGHNREREVAEISAALKGLSRELECPVVCLSQLNRETEQITSRYGKLRGLRESGSMEQDADNVLILTPECDRPECVNTWITAAKQRNGRTDEILTHFDKERQTFTAIDAKAQPMQPESEDERMF